MQAAVSAFCHLGTEEAAKRITIVPWGGEYIIIYDCTRILNFRGICTHFELHVHVGYACIPVQNIILLNHPVWVIQHRDVL